MRCLILLTLWAPKGSESLPTWSWDTVQTYIQFANQSGSFGADAMAAFAKQAFVVFEKDQGRWPQPPQPSDYPTMEYETAQELKAAHACAQVKQANPLTQCYIYTETDWARTQYTLGNDLDALDTGESAARGEPSGLELVCAGAYSGTWDNTTCKACASEDGSGVDFTYWFNAYDFRNATTRAMWVARVVDLMTGEDGGKSGGNGGNDNGGNGGGDGSSSAAVDGAFIDGNRNAWSSSADGSCDKAAQEAWGQGLNASHYLLRSQCDEAANAAGSNSGGSQGPGCTLISNYATEEALTVCDGGMLERFGCSVSYINSLIGLATQGKLAQVHAQYATAEDALNQSLACFLVGMGERSYFGAGNGWNGYGEDNVMTSWMKDWPVYSLPLGEPLGAAAVVVVESDDDAAAVTTTCYTRAFATGTTVFVNITTVVSSAATAATDDAAHSSSSSRSSLFNGGGESNSNEGAVEDSADEQPRNSANSGAGGSPESGLGLGSQITTTCIRWADGNTSGNGCDYV